jgi:flagellar assembly protein FliH
MRKPAVLEKRSISNGEKPSEAADVLSEKQLEEQQLKNKRDAEYERIRGEFMEQCEQALEDARQEAREIVEAAQAQAQRLKEAAEAECVQLRKLAQDEGYSEGFTAGEKPGYDEGYAKGQARCKECLEEVGGILSRIPAEKEKIFKDYENQLFDLIFTISNKITAQSLNQKDKSVIAKMLKEAAKEFRTSSYIKVSLSKLDLEESVNVDIEDLSRIFGETGRQQVEFEVLKDAEKGTLILDNGSEIADASISTQLKMIQNLGMGKFKNKPEEVDEDGLEGLSPGTE